MLANILTFHGIEKWDKFNGKVYKLKSNKDKLLKITRNVNEVITCLEIKKKQEKLKNCIPKINKISVDNKKVYYIEMDNMGIPLDDFIVNMYVKSEFKKQNKFPESFYTLYKLLACGYTTHKLFSNSKIVNHLEVIIIFFYHFEDELDKIIDEINKIQKNQIPYIDLLKIFTKYDKQKTISLDKKFKHYSNLFTIVPIFPKDMFTINKLKEYISIIKLIIEINNIENIKKEWGLFKKWVMDKLKIVFENIRNQLYMIDTLLYSVCGVIQTDRKYDNWVVRLTDESCYLGRDCEFKLGDKYINICAIDIEGMKRPVAKDDEDVNEIAQYNIVNNYYTPESIFSCGLYQLKAMIKLKGFSSYLLDEFKIKMDLITILENDTQFPLYRVDPKYEILNKI